MSWLNKILERGFKFRITLPWMGEKGLGKPMSKDKKITTKEIEKEIKTRLNKGG